LVFGAVAGLALLGSGWSRWSHAQRIEPFLRDGTWCVATTVHSVAPLTSSGFGFQYVAPDSVPHQAAIHFSGRPIYLEADSTKQRLAPARVHLFLNPRNFGDGFAFIPGHGLVHFVGSTFPSGTDVSFASVALEARLPSTGLALYELPAPLQWLCTAVVFFVCGMSLLGLLMGIGFLVASLEGAASYWGEVILCACMVAFGGALAAWWSRRPQRPKTALVGNDGVRLGEDFLPFADIATVQLDKLQLNDGQTHVFIGDGQAMRRLHHACREMESTQLPRSFARKGQRLAAWAQQLAGQLGAAHSQGYRGEMLTVEDLCSVVENPKAPSDERAGAAIALAQNSNDDRLRIANLVETTTSPWLRRVFELSADRNEASLIEEAAALDEQLAAHDESGASMP
jgi:hypothetical protein